MLFNFEKFKCVHTWHGIETPGEMGGSILCKTVKDKDHLLLGSQSCLVKYKLNSDSYG